MSSSHSGRGLLCRYAFLLVVLLAVLGTDAEYRLRHLDTEYLPRSYQPEAFDYNVGAAEQFAVDPNQPIIYVTGLNLIHVVDMSTPGSLSRPYHVEIGPEGSGEGTDVDACGNFVAVSFDNFVSPLDGKVFIYSTYDASAATSMTLLHTFTVGAKPDMVTFTKDCSRLLVAVEGEPKVVNGDLVDPEGLVVIITFTPQGPSVAIADFTRFNNLEEDYVAAGVRRVYSGQGTAASTTFAQDLEPEYITLNDDDTIAYVVLQENNAVAEVDINTAFVIDLHSLGSVSYLTRKIDPSDRDGGINMNNYPIFGMSQPDGVKYVNVDGIGYLITANEGDIKEYEAAEGYPFDWSEAQRGKNFRSGDFASSVSNALISAVGDNAQLGRLDMSTIDGLNANNKFTDLYSYGSRSVSMYRVSDWSRAFDSGDEMERKVAQEFPTIFNSNPNSNDQTPEQRMDTRSENRGPEPESVDCGTTTSGDRLVFVGCERPGFVFVYTMNSVNGAPQLNFQSLNYGGQLGSGDTWRQLYQRRAVRDLGPEDLKFIPAGSGVADHDILAVIGSYTGTISLYEVYNFNGNAPTPAPAPAPTPAPVNPTPAPNGGAVTTAEAAEGGLTTAEVEEGGLTTAEVEEGGLTTAEVEEGGLTTAEVEEGGLTTAEVEEGGLTTAEVEEGGLTTAEVEEGGLTTAENEPEETVVRQKSGSGSSEESD